mmetsp:Transcript_28665/g.54132  ORF Transcript_28665/g.54132 Transcript_28665/m.54132 type:complete len:420 (+) Transcript_28665:176-1435(+)
MDLYSKPASPILSCIPTECLLVVNSFLCMTDLVCLLTTNLKTLRRLDERSPKGSLADLVFKDELARVHSHCRQFGSSMLADAKEILGDFAGALFSIRYSKYQGLWSWPKVTRGGILTCYWDSKALRLTATVMEPQIGLRTELGTYMDGVTGFSSEEVWSISLDGAEKFGGDDGDEGIVRFAETSRASVYEAACPTHQQTLSITLPISGRFKRMWVRRMIEKLPDSKLGKGAKGRPFVCDRIGNFLNPVKEGEIEFEGLYMGEYGPHGPELIDIRGIAGGGCVGLKITGDPNVPAGKLTFRTVPGPFLPCEDTSKNPFSKRNCSCMFACDCNSARWEGCTFLGKYKILAKTAGTNYSNPQESGGTLFVAKTGTGEWSLLLRFEEAFRSSISLKKFEALPGRMFNDKETVATGMTHDIPTF